jgi:hypothetical protein
MREVIWDGEDREERAKRPRTFSPSSKGKRRGCGKGA